MGPASNGVAFAVGDVAGPAQPPAAPSGLTGIVSGNSVMLSWLSGSAGVPASHVVHVGSAPGADDVGMFVAGAAPSLSVSGVPAGTYYVRIVANNAFGTSAQSEELVVAVQ